jgi:hypothetical protein
MARERAALAAARAAAAALWSGAAARAAAAAVAFMLEQAFRHVVRAPDSDVESLIHSKADRWMDQESIFREVGCWLVGSGRQV